MPKIKLIHRIWAAINSLIGGQVVHNDVQRKGAIIPIEGGDLSTDNRSPMSQEDKVTQGRFVSYKLTPEVSRPALVVADNGEAGLNLQVFLDGTNDRASGDVVSQEEARRGMAWRTSVHEGDEVGQWSRPWVKKEEPKPEAAVEAGTTAGEAGTTAGEAGKTDAEVDATKATGTEAAV